MFRDVPLGWIALAAGCTVTALALWFVPIRVRLEGGFADGTARYQVRLTWFRRALFERAGGEAIPPRPWTPRVARWLRRRRTRRAGADGGGAAGGPAAGAAAPGGGQAGGRGALANARRFASAGRYLVTRVTIERVEGWLRVGLDDPARTAWATGAAWAGVGMLVAALQAIPRPPRRYSFRIWPRFDKTDLSLGFLCIMRWRPVHVIGAGSRALLAWARDRRGRPR